MSPEIGPTPSQVQSLGPTSQGHRAYEEPFFWWGPGWVRSEVIPAPGLVVQGVISAEAMAMLGLLVSRRASCVVAAGPSGAGKTTLLTSLLAFVPEDAQLVYVRGSYESFDFVRETNPESTTLLVNELSPHLPVYLWEQGARTAFHLALRGYQLLATAHASSVEDLIYQLSAHPLRVPVAAIAAARLVVILDAWQDGRSARRQVRTIAWLQAGNRAESIDVCPVAFRETPSSPLVVDHRVAADLFVELGGERESYDRNIAILMRNISINW